MPNSNDLAPHGPLSGITVIDLSQDISWPILHVDAERTRRSRDKS